MEPLKNINLPLLSDRPLTQSERRILDLLFRAGPATQARIAETTDLTQQSISRIIGGLVDDGLVRTGDKVQSGRRGYPSASLELVPEFAFSFGVSIMTDAVAITLVDFTGTIRGECRQGFLSLSIGRATDWLAGAMAELLPLAGGRPLAGIGIGVPGSFVGEGAGFNTPHSLEEWANIDVAGLFRERFGLPAFADNDGNVAALGESLVGVGRWARSFAYLYIASGVGGGVILDGEVWRGRHGNAGEFAGGLPANSHPFPNLELLRQLVARQGLPFETVDQLVEGFDPSWPSIDDWVARVRDSLSIIASNATAILDLDAVVLGGRMPRPLAERVIPAIELYDQKRRSQKRPTARIVPAEAPGNAAAIGAAILPLKQRFFKAQVDTGGMSF
ncbi:ROK family transcriptional regulator [Niveispirillum sp. KHB5.9]|uniref:ROK family transcriptional regulator n=1 Tax=Niveispirillum sp. KHB5.9 TaxID=3400269 RepID=UPI003A88D13B